MQMTSKHTPGPWAIEQVGSDAFIIDSKGSGSKCQIRCVAEILGLEGEEIIANARLIAAAADLLKNARLIDHEGCDYYVIPTEDYETIGSAISKAKGEA